MGVEINKVLELEELVKSDEIIFAATGITESTLLQPVMKNGNILKTDTLIIRGKSRTIRHINATHNLKEKMLSESLQKLIL
jgi:fructose-1,6-bisphosphatase II